MKRFFYGILLLFCMLAVCAEKTESWKIADGAVYTSISRPDEPYEIRVIRVLREKKDIVVDMVMANDSVRDLEWVRTAAERMEKTGRKVIAGVNGDFYFMVTSIYSRIN